MDRCRSGSAMVKADKNGLMVHFMKENGLKTGWKAKVNLSVVIKVYMRVTLKLIKLKVTELTSATMKRVEKPTKGNGKIINQMAKQSKVLTLVQNMKGISKKDISMVLVHINGQIIQSTKVIGIPINLMEKVLLYMPMAILTREIG